MHTKTNMKNCSKSNLSIFTNITYSMPQVYRRLWDNVAEKSKKAKDL